MRDERSIEEIVAENSAKGLATHVVPPAGREHITSSADCWCEPMVTSDGMLVVHNVNEVEGP